MLYCCKSGYCFQNTIHEYKQKIKLGVKKILCEESVTINLKKRGTQVQQGWKPLN